VILLEKEYCEKVDIWSVGCIVGELLSMSKEYSTLKVPFNRRQLYAGTSCFPLSPGADQGEKLDETDQLKTILDVMGQLSSCDKSFLTDEEQVDHLD